MTYAPRSDSYLSWHYAINMLRWRLALVRLLRARVEKLRAAE
jgi:hypothetical protein